MARLGVVLFSVLCSCAILTGPVLSAPSASTIEIPKADAKGHVVPFESKNTEEDPDCPWAHVGHTGDTVQAKGGEHKRDSSRSEEGSIQDALRSKSTADPREDGVSRSSYQRTPAVDLSSHDILSGPGPISTGKPRQAKRNSGGYRDPAPSSVRNTSGVDDVARRSIDSARRWGSDPKDDIGVAEDRYPSQYPNWYQRQQYSRYRPNDRRDPYRNYLRYPVFPGR